MRFRSFVRPLREQIEIVDQPRHRRVVAVGRLGLEREAFGEVARADARRVEVLDQRQRLLDQLELLASARGDVAQRDVSDSRSPRASSTISRGEPADGAAERRAAGRADARRARFAGIFQPVEVERLVAAAPPVPTSAKLSVSSAASLPVAVERPVVVAAQRQDQLVGAGLVGAPRRRSRGPRGRSTPSAGLALASAALRAAGSSPSPRR